MKTLIFDFDGTLAESFELLLETFEELIHRAEPLNKKEVASLRGQSLPVILNRLNIKRWQIPLLLFRGRRRMGQKMSSVKPVAGLPSTLEKLNQGGYTMLILSSNSAGNIRDFLRHNDLEHHFKSVYGSKGLFSKPSAIAKVIKKEGLDKTDCIYIGDEVRDIEAAQKMDMDHIAVAWGFNTAGALASAGPRHLIKRPPELIGILEE